MRLTLADLIFLFFVFFTYSLVTSDDILHKFLISMNDIVANYNPLKQESHCYVFANISYNFATYQAAGLRPLINGRRSA